MSPTQVNAEWIAPRPGGVALSRRRTISSLIAGGALALTSGGRQLGVRSQGGTPEPTVATLTIDLAVEPPTLDPAGTYQVDGWSVVHSIYDSLLQFGPLGELEPLLAESFELIDSLTFEVKLRQGIVFHNGEPFDARSVSVTLTHIMDPATASQVAQNFAVIESVEEIDPHTVLLRLREPAPWLPSQIAPWLAMLPPEYATDPASDFANYPIGTGPYRFAGWDRGQQVRLEANAEYFAPSPKGRPIAGSVAFRFVGDASTRVADLLSGSAGLIRDVPVDTVEAVRAGSAEVVTVPISGSAWVRVPNDVEPFVDARVRQALNYAVDIEGIVQALLGGNGRRLAGFFVPNGLGYDPDLAPYQFDPDRARQLLAEAGYPDGFETTLEFASTEATDLVVAIAGQLTEVGIRTEIQPVELATFNATWQDLATAPLRFLTWRPMFDPYTLLSLIVSSEGFLSRYRNSDAQALIEAGSAQTDAAARAEIYQALGRELFQDPAAIYGYDLVSQFGVADGTPAWTPRADDYLIPTFRE